MIVKFLSIPVLAGMLICGVYLGNIWFAAAAASLLLMLGCTVANFVIGGRLKCPLCMMPPLANRGCARHRDAGRMFGSYRLVVAGSILIKDSFRCPYCGEPTVMEARKRGGGGRFP